MNQILLLPDPPAAGKPLEICYWWDTPVPGTVVTIDMAFDDGSGDQQCQVVCPAFGNQWCVTVGPMPSSGHTVTFTDTSGAASQESRVVV